MSGSDTQVTMTEQKARKVLDSLRPAQMVKLTFHAASTTLDTLYAFRQPWVEKRMALAFAGVQPLAELLGAMVARKLPTVADLPPQYQNMLTFEVTPFDDVACDSLVALAPHIIDMAVL